MSALFFRTMQCYIVFCKQEVIIYMRCLVLESLNLSLHLICSVCIPT